MAILLLNFVNNLGKGNHKIKLNIIRKYVKRVELNTEIVTAFLNTHNLNIVIKDNLIEYKCLCCSKDYQKMFVKNLKKRFFNTYKFSDYDKKKIFCCEKMFTHTISMDDWETFNEISLPEKEEFYSLLNMEDITDEDYMHAKRASKDFEIITLTGLSRFILSKRYLIVRCCI